MIALHRCKADNIARYGPIFLCFNIVVLAMASSFWVDAIKAPASFSAEIWGRMAYELPAELWAFTLMASATVTILGLMHPQHRGMIALGAVGTATIQAALAYSIITTGGVDIIGRWSAMIALFSLWNGYCAVGR